MTSPLQERFDLAAVDLDRIGAALAGLERPTRVTLKSIVRTRLDAILDARRRGFGYQQIAQAITEAGCPITAATLRKYLTQLRPQSRSPSHTDPHAVTGKAPVVTPASAGDATPRRSLRRAHHLAASEVSPSHPSSSSHPAESSCSIKD